MDESVYKENQAAQQWCVAGFSVDPICYKRLVPPDFSFPATTVYRALVLSEQLERFKFTGLRRRILHVIHKRFR